MPNVAPNSDHVIICGGSSESRRQRLDQICQELAQTERSKLFVLKENLASLDKFLQAAKQRLPMRVAIEGQRKEQLSLDQVRDLWLDWVGSFDEVLIAIPETERFYKKDPIGFFEILGDILTQSHLLAASGRKRTKFRTVLSLESHIPDLEAKVPLFVGRDPAEEEAVPRSELIRRFFKIIELPA